jgi:hypothetical protein
MVLQNKLNAIREELAPYKIEFTILRQHLLTLR